MADSVYKQAADQVASQVKTLADAVAENLTPEPTIPVRYGLHWEDILMNLVSVRVVEDAAEQEEGSTNGRDIWVYPVYVFWTLERRPHWDTRRNNIHKLKQSCRQYFNNRRRMSGVSETSVNQWPTRFVDKAPQPPEEMRQDKDVHGFTILCKFLEPRTA